MSDDDHDQPKKERRGHPRAQLTASVHLRTDGVRQAAFIENIDAGGIFIAGVEVPEGTAVELDFALPDDGPPIYAEGEVRWVFGPRRSIDGRPGLGVRFTSLSDANQARIDRLVARHRTLYRED